MRHGRDPAAILGALEAHNLAVLLAEVCERRGVATSDLCGRSRTQAIVRARQELWWCIRNHPGRSYSYVEIARLFGRDHSTVFHGIRAHTRRQGP